MRHTRIWLAVITLVAVSLACTLPGGPKLPASPIPVSTEAAGQLEEAVRTAVAEATQSGELNLTLTEEQVTSYIALKLAEQPNPPLTNPQVFLRDGKIQIFGTAQAGQVTAQAQIVLTPSVGSDGKLNLAIDKADFGPIPVPQSMLDSISKALDDAITQQAGGQVTLSSVTVADGQITLVGTVAK